MLSKLGIRLQPPGGVRDKDKMGCSLATESFEIVDSLLTVLWIAAINSILLEKMPTLTFRIIKDGWVPIVHGNNQCIARRNLVKFQTGIALLCG